MTVYEKLLKVQNQLKAPKGQYNSFGKYYYRSAEDILEAVKPICLEHKAVTYLTDKMVLLGDRYYIESTCHFVDIETGDKITNTSYAREEETRKGMNHDQLTGATGSYARKYALNGMFCIDDNKDSDYTNEEKDRAKDNVAKDREKEKKELEKNKNNKSNTQNKGNTNTKPDAKTKDKKPLTDEEKKKLAIQKVLEVADGSEEVLKAFYMSYGVANLQECTIKQLIEIYNTIKGDEK